MTAQHLVLLPGLLCDEAVWTRQRAGLAPVTTFVPSYSDLRSINAMALSVLAQATSPRFALAGHSMGGRVALEILRLAPQRVERVALLDTGMDPIAPGAAGEQERAGRLALLEKARRSGMRSMGAEWARGMVHRSRLDSPLFEDILAMIERQTPATFEAQIEALLTRPDVRPVLEGLRCPVLLACGRQDAWSPLARHEQMQALCPGARLVVIEDSGHMSPMEQPQAVTAALAAWLAQG
ncbi:alpha/beta hydrolase [Ramlibacter sp. XY19]|uniref:alpha/beta fold hydrolase n=1 Tax=Ramlibacter paludis TaxID=2908000 RepID=UPI0023DA7D93|nr:alpha/beta hydrolase [Ramlibacter paludis]MCG2594312.1 alpha/beta hydrolase [Ramlibacter paludis]